MTELNIRHVHNLTAKVLRETWPDGIEVDGRQRLTERSRWVVIAMAFAKRFNEDEGFDPVVWLNQCSPNSTYYPLGDLWNP